MNNSNEGHIRTAHLPFCPDTRSPTKTTAHRQAAQDHAPAPEAQTDGNANTGGPLSLEWSNGGTALAGQLITGSRARISRLPSVAVRHLFFLSVDRVLMSCV